MCWGRSLLWSWSDCCAIGHIGRDDTSAIVATILCMTTEKKSKQLAAIYIFDVIRPIACFSYSDDIIRLLEQND